MAKVLLVREPVNGCVKYNLNATKSYGDLVYLNCSINNCTTEEFGISIIDAALTANYDPKNDYFAVTGNIVEVAVALAALLTHFDFVRLLIFNPKINEYVLREIDAYSWLPEDH